VLWQVLVGNVAAVSLVISVWMHLHYKFYRLSKVNAKLSFGLMMGLGSLLSMLLSIEVDNGYYLDLRSTLLAISAVYGGPLAVLVTASITFVFRIFMGGAGLVPGLISIAAVSLCGLLAYLVLGRGTMDIKKMAATAFVVAAVSLTMSILYRGNGSYLALFGLSMIAVKTMATLLAAAVITYFHGFTLERDILRAALTQAPDFHYVKDQESRFVVTNLNVARSHGRTRSSEMVGLTDFDLFPLETAQSFFDQEQEIMSTGQPMVDFELPWTDEDGKPRWLSSSKVPLRNRHGDLIGLAGVTRDITDRKRLIQEALDSKHMLSQAMMEMSDGLAMFDPDGRLVFCNEQYRAAFPRSAHVRQHGAHITDIVRAVVRNGERVDVSADVDEEWIQASAAQLFTTRNTEVPLFDGRWLSLRTRLAADGSALVVVSDITANKRSEEELKQLAQEMKGLAETDGLTGIANRRMFDEAISVQFAHAARGGAPLSLLLIDIDHFKLFNDTYGHIEGDKCLKIIADVLRSVTRRPSDLAARFGGEEFAVLLPGTDINGALRLAGSLQSTLHDRAIPHGASDRLIVTASVGVASISDRTVFDTPEELIQVADRALYEAKRQGRDRVIAASDVAKAA
jgi:diguanylate cyclase (GGDEF)-like protein/PAS domain S-box-containing protein